MNLSVYIRDRFGSPFSSIFKPSISKVGAIVVLVFLSRDLGKEINYREDDDSCHGLSGARHGDVKPLLTLRFFFGSNAGACSRIGKASVPDLERLGLPTPAASYSRLTP